MAQMTHKLKVLTQQHQAVLGELTTVYAECNLLQDRVEKLQRRLKSIERDLEACTRDTPIVSEHALLRYVERVLGYDLEVLTTAILTETVLAQIATVGSGQFPVDSCGHNFIAVVKQNVVVTIET